MLGESPGKTQQTAMGMGPLHSPMVRASLWAMHSPVLGKGGGRAGDLLPPTNIHAFFPTVTSSQEYDLRLLYWTGGGDTLLHWWGGG